MGAEGEGVRSTCDNGARRLKHAARAPGALALSLKRGEGSGNGQGEGKKGVETADGELSKSSKKGTRHPKCHLGRRVSFCGADLVTGS
jgi:hypothetical protein